MRGVFQTIFQQGEDAAGTAADAHPPGGLRGRAPRSDPHQRPGAWHPAARGQPHLGVPWDQKGGQQMGVSSQGGYPKNAGWG